MLSLRVQRTINSFFANPGCGGGKAAEFLGTRIAPGLLVLHIKLEYVHPRWFLWDLTM